MFAISPPPHFFIWDTIVVLVLRARYKSSSPLSLQILPDLISQRIPAWIRTHNSFYLLYGIGNAIHNRPYDSWEHGIELFTDLDKVMVEMCCDPEDVEGFDEEGVERWRKLRGNFIERTFWGAPTHLKLSVGHFDTLAGHGPLPIPPNLYPIVFSSRTSLSEERQTETKESSQRQENVPVNTAHVSYDRATE